MQLFELGRTVLERVPPGDTWKYVNTDETFESLTDALNAVYMAEGEREFFVSAKHGVVYTIGSSSEQLEPVEPPKNTKFSIYDD